jgi:serine/threonine protein kinase
MAGETWREADMSDRSRDQADTIREGSSSASTIREQEADVGRQSTRSVLHLPSALAGQWRIERELISRGAEADLILVCDALGERRVAKIYRAGIEPKTNVLERVGGTSFEHVVRLFDHGQSDGRSYELLEYVEHGSLEDLIRQEGPRVPDQRVREILAEVATAIDHLHHHEVVHRDIKPSNVLVRTLQPLDLVLADFGIASVLGQESRRFTTGNRTIAYSAPETAAGEISQAADWWPLGIMLVEMLTGHHPFAGAQPGEMMNDQAIMSQLFQMPVDRLVEGVADPWRILCRGLLRRDARNRWGNSEIERWLRGDPTLRVVDESPLGIPEYPPFFFAGQKYSSLQEIARAFAQNWTEARKIVERGHLLNWVKDDLRDNEWRQFLSDLDRDCSDLDERVFRIVAKADPTATPVYCGYPFDPDGLRRLANDALTTNDAQPIVAKLFDRQLLVAAAEATGNANLRLLHESWSAQLESYGAQSEAVGQAGAPRQPIDQSFGQARAAMLLSVLPGGQRYLNELRESAKQASSEGLHECAWFNALGDASRVGPPALFLIGLLAPHAEAPAAEARRLRLQKEADDRNAQIALWAKIAGAGVFIAVLIGIFLWYNSPANVAARQEAQRQAEIARQQQDLQRQQAIERQRQEQLRQQQERQQQIEAQRQREAQQREAERQRQLAEQQRRQQEEAARRLCRTISTGQTFCCVAGERNWTGAGRIFCCPAALDATLFQPQQILQMCRYIR